MDIEVGKEVEVLEDDTDMEGTEREPVIFTE